MLVYVCVSVCVFVVLTSGYAVLLKAKKPETH